jgi:hypothetical protein
MSMDKAEAKLSNALRRINASYVRLAPGTLIEVPIGYDEFDRRIDEALIANDLDGAVEAIDGFRDHWLKELGALR